MSALRLERLRRFRLFGESWSGDKLAAFSESTRWSSFPYFTWVLSPALEWSSAHTKKKKKKAAEQKILACDTMLLDLQKKKKANRFRLQFDQKQNRTHHHHWCSANHGTVREIVGFIFFSFEKWNELESLLLSFFCLPLFFWHYSDELLHCSLELCLLTKAAVWNPE